MQPRSTTPPSAPRASWLSRVGVIALAGVIFVGLTTYLRSLDDRTDRLVREQLLPTGEPRPAAEVISQVRALKLVTVEVDSRVATTATDLSWRGDVAARVEAPVKLLYGVDLSDLTLEHVAVSPLSGGLVLRVPPPQRIATEVFGERETSDLSLGWLRFRATSGEFYLGQARQGLHRRARELSLPPEQAARVVELTREQLTTLIKKIVGDVPVTILFQNDPSDGAGAKGPVANGSAP